ncbi:MAG: prepilin-type N-terminal cleavage/methylation domain-containing protein [Phycisphaerales bacterium]
MTRVEPSAGPLRNRQQSRRAQGFTLVEQVVAAVILAVAALGALQYQYFAAGQGRIGRVQSAAARAAHLLIEDWKSTAGATDYDPSGLGMGFSSGIAVPSGYATPSGLGATLNNAVYSATFCDVPALVMLKYLDVQQDTLAKTTLRQIAVIVRFGQVGSGGGMTVAEAKFAQLPPITLVTYVRLDATDG